MTDFRSSAAAARIRNQPQLAQATRDFQQFLQKNGIAWHNTFTDECCGDFACCWEFNLSDVYYPVRYGPQNQLVAPEVWANWDSWDPVFVRINMLDFHNRMSDKGVVKDFNQYDHIAASRLNRVIPMLEALHLSWAYRIQPGQFIMTSEARSIEPHYSLQKWYVKN